MVSDKLENYNINFPNSIVFVDIKHGIIEFTNSTLI